MKTYVSFIIIPMMLICCNEKHEQIKKTIPNPSIPILEEKELATTLSSNSEWWQLHIEGNDTTVHPYKYIVVSNDTIFCYDDMDYDVRLISKDQKSIDKRIIEVIANDEKYCYEATLIDENCCRWKIPSYWYEEGNGIYTNDKSRYKTYNFGIDTIYQNIGIEKVEAKWNGLYEIFKTFYIGDTEPRDSFYRYYKLFVDSALFILENRQTHYYDYYPLYVFSESSNLLQLTQGFNDDIPKDTIELFFDGDDYYISLRCFSTDFPSLTKASKEKTDRKEIHYLRDLHKYNYAKKIPHRDGKYLELPFIERDED